MRAVTWHSVTARRMTRHALAERAADLDPAGVAAVLCGAHAQLLSAAELCLQAPQVWQRHNRGFLAAEPDHLISLALGLCGWLRGHRGT